MFYFRKLTAVFAVTGCFGISGCTTAAQHASQLPSTSERQLTLGVVQRDIRKGMDQGAVASALGAPNIVSQDANGQETWVYDKIATEAAYSESSASGGVGALGVIPGLGVLAGASASQSSGAASQTQRTLTVVIKFRKGLVDDISYHSSSF